MPASEPPSLPRPDPGVALGHDAAAVLPNAGALAGPAPSSAPARPDPSSPLRTILVGVDGSPGAARALAWATARAKESGATVVAVHVLTWSTELRRDVSLDTMTTWRRKLGRCLDREWTAPARRAGVAVRCALVHDDSAAAGLLSAAAGQHADLVVLGTHGHGHLTDRLLGATTYKVSHRAHTPVVIVPPA